MGIVAFPWLLVSLFINLDDAGTNTFCKIDTREDANIHHSIACQYLSNCICTVVGEWHHGYFSLGYFSSSTHFDLVMRLAREVWRLCDLVFGHDRYSHAGNCVGLLSNTGLFLSTGDKYLFPPSTPLSPFRFLTTAPVAILPCLASKFRNRSF